MKSIVIGLSGGMDSATLLGYAVNEEFDRIICCSFYYGSKHNEYELKAAREIVHYYQVQGINISHYFFNIGKTFLYTKSNLMKEGGAIPEGHYEHESMAQTVVPGRNLIFASIMASVAETEKAQCVALGVHSGDHAIYPDCRPEFIRALQSTIKASTDGKVDVIAPFIHDNKTEILQYGFASTPIVPYHLTRTCYKDQPISCGKCGSCQERLEAFKILGIIDPIPYE